jgi:D-cysteine desulfhydrase family pyridoxal phosphate-dependent enzyme
VEVAHLPTPCDPLDRLGAHLGLPPGTLWAKRDDMTGLAGGGNKARKLVRLCADAIAQGCDTLVTGGGRQSNHARITAAAANRLGLGCIVVLASERPDVPTGNVVLDELLGPEIVWAGPLDYYPLEERIEREAERARTAGRRPYVVPVGGASTIGAAAYADAVTELEAQLPDVGIVVVADGSGGTHAGLVAGFGDHARVLGIDVGIRPDLDDVVPATAAAVAVAMGTSPPAGRVQVDHDRYGEGYGAPTDAAWEALALAARLEGLVLDPVNTAKAMAGLVAGVREGRLARDAPIVFLHTGGMPALFSSRYAAWIRECSRD